MSLIDPTTHRGTITGLFRALEERGEAWIPHLSELRMRIGWALAALSVGMIVAWSLSPSLLMAFENVAGRLIFIAPAEGLIVRFKMAFVLGVLLASPVWVYHGWRFTAPGLLPREKRALAMFIALGGLLFVAGTAFGYAVVYPLALHFFIGFSGPDLQPAIVVSKYFRFVLSTTASFGLAFQLPAVLLALIRFQFVTVSTLRHWRRAAVFLAFVMGAVLTPADVLSQVMMALPLIGLFELTVLIGPLVEKGGRA